VDARRTQYLRARLQLADLPFVKTFGQFDCSFQPSIDERQICELRSPAFIHKASNVVFPGTTRCRQDSPERGAGGSRGSGRLRCVFHDGARTWLRISGCAYREGRLDRRLRVYLAPQVLIIEEMGYLPLDELGATIFFQLVSARYEGGSILLTSNKSYGVLGTIFGDPIIATAILVRLLHHSTTINIRVESDRLMDRPQGRAVPSRGRGRWTNCPFPFPEILQNGPRPQGSAARAKSARPCQFPAVPQNLANKRERSDGQRLGGDFQPALTQVRPEDVRQSWLFL
jgi:hypothetical protein